MAGGEDFEEKLGPKDEWLKKRHEAYSKMVDTNPNHTVGSITADEYLKRIENLTPDQIQKIRAEANLKGSGQNALAQFIQSNVKK